MSLPEPGRHSDDGAWWWTGSRWEPAWSHDRQWWFNGSAWTRVSVPKTFPAPRGIEFAMAAVWTVLWAIGLVWCLAVVSQTEPGGGMSVELQRAGLFLGLGVLALLSVCGFILGRARRWTYVWMLTGYVWALLLALYVVAMLAAPTNGGGDNDTAAGAGLVILGLPMLFIVGIFVGIGAGASLLCGRRTGSSAA